MRCFCCISSTLLLLLLLLLLICSLSCGQSTDNEEEEDDKKSNNSSKKKIFDESELLAELIPPGYNKFEVPKDKSAATDGSDGDPVRVTVFFKIYSILEIDESKDRITLDTDIQLEWRDFYMLEHGKRTERGMSWRAVDPKFLNKIWQPDLYIESLISPGIAGLTGPPTYLRMRSSFGAIIYRFRVSPTIKCSMEFKYYPADTQNCTITLRSYAYSFDFINLDWWGDGVYLLDSSDANFEIQIASTLSQRIEFKRTYQEAGYDTLHFTILARRKLSYHILQTYTPSSLFVCITWLCFLLPSSMVEARIGITMTTLLTLTAMFASVRESTPTVSYIKAIDIWMVGCICFVFVILLEFSILIWLRHIKKSQESQRKKNDGDGGDGVIGNGIEDNKSCTVKIDQVDEYSKTNCILKLTAQFEKFAILIYGSLFIGFTIIYWVWLLSAGKYFEWSVNERYTHVDNPGED